ncbi:Crp/Fnr family transcriptional regulator [Paenibacillus zeisoli]|uniref:Crp/Fnr family transcriptional regulator n=1 Tax=Paenibacillus zeisoli TaxID=2496267 RepID=A0A433XNQ0_9BACL|nr:Crp/Fnr family transcriptional regulator [Paenibacillus zeisoli]RUT35721.1 Crp/Fnr family transcriptional regulator [Paenibacillus zeisoli]
MMCQAAVCCENSESCIHHVPVFEKLSPDQKELLTSIAKSAPFTKGSYVFHEGEQSESLYVLSHGLVKLTKIADNGREHILRFLFPGDFFGQFALLQDKQHYASAEVLEPSVICRLHKDDFRPLLESHPQLSYSFLLAMSDQLQQADEWAGAMHVMDVEQRLAMMIVHYWRKQSADGYRVILPAAKKELSSMIGTTPETLSRKLTQWVNDGIIHMKLRTLDILAPDRLIELSTQ